MLFFFYFLILPTLAIFSKQEPLDSESIHYSIQDMVLKYRNLTSIDTEDISLFQSSSDFATNTCIKDAVHPIMKECLNDNINELNLKLRSKTAAKLSVCEFIVSGIEYPDECKKKEGYEDMEMCVIAMERRSQWWTSYSGYYRSIGEICHQERLPFEKDSILNMFLEVTEHYGNVLEFLKEYSTVFEEFEVGSKNSFSKLFEFMDELNDKADHSKLEMNEIWDFIKENLQKMSEMSNEVTDLAVNKNKELENSVSSLFANVEKEYELNLQVLKDKFLQDVEFRSNTVNKLIKSTEQGLQGIHDLNLINAEMSMFLNQELEQNKEKLGNMNGLLEEMNETSHEIIGNMNSLKEMVEKIINYVNKIATVIQTFTLEVLVLFTSFSIISLVTFHLLVTSNIFHLIGLIMMSTVCGAVITICVIH